MEVLVPRDDENPFFTLSKNPCRHQPLGMAKLFFSSLLLKIRHESSDLSPNHHGNGLDRITSHRCEAERGRWTLNRECSPLQSFPKDFHMAVTDVKKRPRSHGDGFVVKNGTKFLSRTVSSSRSHYRSLSRTKSERQPQPSRDLRFSCPSWIRIDEKVQGNLFENFGVGDKGREASGPGPQHD